MRRTLLITVFALVTVTTASCANGTSRDGDAVLVFAAGSLTDAFADLEAAFEAVEPDTDVRLSLAASSTLREQIVEGAPADVYASADPSTMAEVVAAGLVDGESAVFATNSMQIAVPLGNPAGIAGLDAFAEPSLLIGLCAPQVPCGRYGRRVLASAGIVPSIDTSEPNVRALLTKLEVGELDAGLVYATDVAASGRVEGIAIAAEWNVVARYPIAVLAGAPDAAVRFAAFVRSDAGQAILAEHGFGSP